MKGLLMKDLCLSFQNSRTFILYLFISLFMAFSMDGSFIVGYTAMLMGMVAIGTVNYDEADNGFPFLFSLPTDRKTYIREKFLYCALLETAGALFGVVIWLVTSFLKGQTVDVAGELSFIISFVVSMYIAATAMIALQIRFGSDKSRLVLVLFYGVIFALALFLKKVEGAERFMHGIVSVLNQAPQLLIVLCISAVLIGIEFLIYLFAVRTMEKKEF